MSFNTDQTTQDQKAGEAGTAEVTATDQTISLTVNGKTYGSADDIIKKIQNADQHIATLESEAAARKQAEDQAAAEQQQAVNRELLDELKKQGRNVDQTDQSSKAGLNEGDIERLVADSLSKHLSNTKKDANMDDCMQRAEQEYGGEYIAKVQERATALNMDMDAVDNLAKNTPEAFRELFLPKHQEQGGSSFASGSKQSATALDLNSGNSNGGEKVHSIAHQNSSKSKKTITELGEEMGLYKDCIR